MVITALRRAQNQNRRHPEIIMVGSAVVITRIIPRSPIQPRGQTFRRLQHRKRQRGDGGSEKNFAAAFVFVPDVRQTREFRRGVEGITGLRAEAVGHG
jgi:hypothetical protein